MLSNSFATSKLIGMRLVRTLVYGLVSFLVFSIVGGAARYYLNLSPNIMVLITCCGTICGSLLLSVLNRRESTVNFSVFLWSVCCASLLLLAWLSIHDYQLLSTGNGDAGLHVLFMRKFLGRQPHAYHGFVGFYAAVYSVMTFASVPVYVAQFTVLALSFWCASWLIAEILFAATHHCFSQREPISLAIKLPTSIVYFVIGAYLLLPLGSQFVIQGGYAQAFGFFIYPFLAWLWAGAQGDVARLLVLSLGIMLVRHVYGLHLPEVLLASTALALMRGGMLRLTNVYWTIVWFLFAVICGVAFVLVGNATLPLVTKGGSTTIVYLPYVIIGWALTVLGCSVVLAQKEKMHGSRSSASEPLGLSIALISSAVALHTTLMTYRVFVLGRPILLKYYVLKSTFFASVLASACAAFVFLFGLNLLWGAARNLSGPQRQLCFCKGMFLVMVSLGAGYCLSVGYSKYYQEGYHTEGKRPIVDQSKLHSMQSLLVQTNFQFGGYFDSFWPKFHYMNNLFSLAVNPVDVFHFPLVPKPGYCLFWPSGEEESRLRKLLSGRRQIASANYRSFKAAYSLVAKSSSPATDLAGELAEASLYYWCKYPTQGKDVVRSKDIFKN